MNAGPLNAGHLHLADLGSLLRTFVPRSRIMLKLEDRSNRIFRGESGVKVGAREKTIACDIMSSRSGINWDSTMHV